MSEENNKIEQPIEPRESAVEETAPTVAEQRAFFTRRRVGFSLGFLALILLLLSFSSVVLYRAGYLDNYIKKQFVAKMNDIGVDFSADVFQVRVAPLRLELKNATFNDRVSGEKLFFVRQADLNLTVTNLYAWQLSRDISVDTTDVDGVEAWVKFDENGKSNFSNLNLVQDEAGSRVNFKYSSAKFSLKNGIVHYGDTQHKIDADARNILFLLEPEDASVPDEQKRFKFDVTSTDSRLVYDEQSTVENIDVRAKGIADNYGAEVSEFKLTTPLGESTLTGKLTDWERLQYDFNVDSTIDLTQASGVFPLGTAIRGVGNFNGHVTGEGAKYKVEGNIQSDALAASNIRLKGLKVDATVAGENSMYEANGKAVAEMLTFEDFKIDFLQAVGNIRGTGTDFKWFGELQAAAAKSPLGTIAGLYITDAAAEYKDNQFIANLGNLRAGNFKSEDASAQGLQAQNVRIFSDDNRTEFSAPNLRAGALAVGTTAKLKGVAIANLKGTKRGDETNVTASNLQANSLEAAGATIQGVNAGDVKLKNRGSRTDVNAGNLRAQSVQTKDARLRNLTAKNVTAQRTNGGTDVQVGSAQADGFNIGGGNGGVAFGAIEANGIDIKDRDGGATAVYADNLRTAKIETSAAILGSVNVAGVRLTLLRGRIEARADSQVNVGDIALTKNTLPDGGNLQAVKLNKAVFVLEPSGHYRASADMSLGGGVLGSVKLGAARAQVVAENEQVAFNNLTADVMDGAINGNAVIALNNRRQSRVNAAFSNLDLSKLLALQGGRIVPIEGKTTGNANLTFAGTNFKTASGILTADFAANAGTEERGLVPVNGKLGLRATNGLFNVDYANLNTEKTALNATGQFDLSGENSNLNLALNSSDASEIERIIRVLNISPELEAKLDQYQAQFAGNFKFDGNLTGNLSSPTVEGRASIESLVLRGRNLGSVATNLLVSSAGDVNLRDGVLRQPDGGNLAFNVSVPSGNTSNISVEAKLNDINTGNLLAALPVGFLPAQFQDFDAKTSGTVNISGIPDNLQGEANISSGKGTIKGQPFDGFDLRATFAGTLVNLENFRARFGDGFLAATGTYRTNEGAFDLNVEGKNILFERVRPFIPNEASLPAIAGTVDLTAKATGAGDDFKTYNINFSGVGRSVVVGENNIGDVTFNGTTQNQQLNANLTASFQGQPQAITASVNFADPNLPFKAETVFNNTELAPFIALVRPPDQVSITGQATGRVFVEGNLYGTDAKTGKPGFTTDNLRGAASFNQFGLQIGETQLVASEPVAVEFDSKEIRIQNAKFSGSGTNLVVSGVKALTDDGYNNLAINGRINLSVLNALSKNTFAAGFADVSVSLKGVNRTAQLGGMATLANAALSTFIGSERIALDRVNGGIRFSSNQAQIDNLTGFLGGGKITASGGASVEGLQLQAFRLSVHGTNITAPVPPGFITTGDANIEFSGVRTGKIMNSLIAGDFNARRSVYTKDIDIADFVSGRREGSLTESSSANTASSTDSFVGTPNIDIRIEGRDALVVRNNIADLTASASLRVTGDTEFPVISGRVTAESGTILFRKERYEVQRAVIEFPPNANNSPFVNVQAETEIKGYQIFVNLVGDVSDTENLNATVRSNPNLPQADVISLITTGNLANTDTGIPTLASSGINTAAEILTDELINNPLSRATDKLFGLNRFEIDPIISGERLNPSARLTVGRQINRNLLITYSTNLSGDQNQVLALEYRVSNRISFVAQYEQRSLSNVTRNNNNFNFEIRLRKRF